jgi:hypothetical protein
MPPTLSQAVIAHDPPVMDAYMRTCWEEVQLRIIGDGPHNTPGDVLVLAFIAWLNAYAEDGEWDVFMEWPGGTRFTIDDEGALLIETPDFMGRCNPYDMLDQLLIVLDAFISAHPAAYDRLLATYYK